MSVVADELYNDWQVSHREVCKGESDSEIVVQRT